MVSVEWHARLRRSPLSSWVIGLKDRVDYVRWQRANVAGANAGSTCPLQKRYALLKLLRSRKLDLVVETGTFLGDMASFLSGHGYEVVTIELDAKLAALARLRFNGNSRIRLIEGDSGTRLPAVVEKLTRPCSVLSRRALFRPGHRQGRDRNADLGGDRFHPGASAGRKRGCDDDARCFGTSPDYPPLQDFLGASRGRGVTDAHVANDAIVFSVPAAA